MSGLVPPLRSDAMHLAHMEQITIRDQRGLSEQRLSGGWKIGSIVVSSVAVFLSIATFTLHQLELGSGLLILAALTFCFGAFLHARFLYLARQQFRQTSGVLETREREFQSIFENALDSILILDDQAICHHANPAALQLFGVSRDRLIGISMVRFYATPHDFDASWEQLLIEERSHGQIELAREGDAAVFAEFTARANILPGRHLMILRDITRRRQAEEALGKNLALAKSARREADALRQATLALTQDLRLDHVLDTLLKTLHLLVPYGTAQVLLRETETKLFLAREVFSAGAGRPLQEWPKTLEITEYTLLEKALEDPDGIVIFDTGEEKAWRPVLQATPICSWIGVPLLSSNQVLGLLSLSHTEPGHFTQEHLRRTRSLAIPAAAAIQNARLYEQAAIYGAELEQRLADLRNARVALEWSEENRHASEDRFQRLFRATPIAFSVTALEDGRFIDVNEAFERRYGYTREELIHRTASELGFWDDPHERSRLVEELRRGGHIRSRVARFRLKSGEWKVSLYSAETIPLDGQVCLLVVSDDLPPTDPNHFH